MLKRFTAADFTFTYSFMVIFFEKYSSYNSNYNSSYINTIWVFWTLGITDTDHVVQLKTVVMQQLS